MKFAGKWLAKALELRYKAKLIHFYSLRDLALYLIVEMLALYRIHDSSFDCISTAYLLFYLFALRRISSRENTSQAKGYSIISTQPILAGTNLIQVPATDNCPRS